jgi:serine/threonine-protein kinase
MLYCPKCQQTYEEAAQRFCLKDGARLLPAPSSGKSANQAGGVFSKILNRNSQTDAEGNPTNSFPSFSPPAGKMFRAEEDLLSLPEIATPQKPLPRIIKTSEVPMSQASLGDRKINPTGRPALSWENPNALLQQTVKNRYLITKKLEQDENSIGYLAGDKLVPNKKVLVRILMDQDASDKFTNKIFAEESVSLSHVNHPNIASVIDSGELLEGFPFIITEYVEGTSVKDMLNRKGEFNGLRTARIVRQVSYALSEVHQNRVLHRNLKPENLILTLNEEGAEQVKLINFGVPNAKTNKENLAYKSPEQLEGNTATFASDIYSLAVVAYQMLTGRLPFNTSSIVNLLKSQREGMTLSPTNLRLDLPPAIDGIFERAFAFSPSERYPKARDFGDALYNALNAAVSAEKIEQSSAAEKINILPNERIEENVRKAISQTENVSLNQTDEVLLPAMPAATFGEVKDEGFELDIPSAERNSSAGSVISLENVDALESADAPPDVEKFIESEVKAPKDLAWEKRSPEPPQVGNSSKVLLSLLGIAILLAGMFAVWSYVLNRPNNIPIVSTPTENVNVSVQNSEIAATGNLNAAPENSNAAIENLNAAAQPLPTPKDIEVPPPARTIAQPPNTVFFETNKENLTGDLLRNFVGFSLYYPNDWVKNDAQNNFLDVAKKSADGKPVEQLLVSYYDSKGTFETDEQKFATLVEKSNKDLAKIIPGYRIVSKQETKINGDWRAYEVKFQGSGETQKDGKKLTIWGRRIWIPAARPGTKNGYVVTMLATSLSPEITNIYDVGVKGDLGTVFGTFEPNQNF